MNATARPGNKAVRKGLAHLDAGRIENAERLFRSVLKSEPNNPEANHALGTLAIQQGNLPSALAFLTAALQARTFAAKRNPASQASVFRSTALSWSRANGPINTFSTTRSTSRWIRFRSTAAPRRWTMGVTMLNNVGLPEMIAESEAAYVDLATGLATDTSKLRAIRHNLRQKMADSRMMDFAAFAHDIEAAYRDMWQAWCANRTTSPANKPSASA